MKPLCAAALLAALAGPAPAQQPGEPRFQLRKGDRICVVGNTLADRMQHHGWLETLLHARFPEHELVVRNLGFSGDELTLRLRSSGFGSPDDHLRFNKADVVFAFFGYNESFGGEAGLPKFRKDLADYVKHVTSQTYNGKEPPRLVLFAPLAHEDLKDPNLPDGKAANARLAPYALAMGEVAQAAGVLCVDLFSASLALAPPAPLTINGIHLNERGDRRIAEVIDRSLFGIPTAPHEPTLTAIRAAVLDKNFHWYQRHRATDGFSSFGGRADLKFVEGQTNRVVMQREFEILDVLTANRDRRAWAAARRQDLAADDSNAPPHVPVRTNKPGTGAGGQHVFMEGEAAISRMQTGKGLKVQLVASEEMFPELANPVQMAFDPKGRLWVAAWPTYPHWTPQQPLNDKLLILEDKDGDGRADVCKTFAGDLHNPTGFEFWNGGVLVANAPGLLFLKDTDGDDRADTRERLLEGIDSADTHHAANSFVIDPGGALYFQEGTFHHSQIESPWGPVRRLANAGVFRFEPRTHKVDVYVSYGFANPHGHVFDRWGQDFVTDGTGADTYFALAFSGSVDFPRKHPGLPTVYKKRTRPCPATEYLSSSHFPEEMQGNLLVANVIGFQGILQYRISDQGSGFDGAEQEVVVQSSDPNFRPSDLEVGPDGAIYFTDWQNPIIGHMQHNLRDPSRDRSHGRVYRVVHKDRPLVKPAPVAGEPVAKLLDLLKSPEDRVRYRARLELGSRKTGEVMAALKGWIAGLDKGDRDYEHHRLEGLWLHQNHNVVNEELLRQVLRSPEPRARAAATRVLRWWGDRIPDALALLEAQAVDGHPRVRLEAIVAASWFRCAEAALVAIKAQSLERDVYINYALKETMATLDPWWKPALREGKITSKDPAVVEFLLANVPTAELSKLPRSEGVCVALLTRPGVAADQRRGALADLAKFRKETETAALLGVIERSASDDLARILASRPADELRAELPRIKALTSRRASLAAWMTAAGGAEEAYAAAKAADALRDFLDSVALLSDDRVRAALYPQIRAMVKDAPATAPSAAKRGLQVDYFELAPPNVALETLAKLKPNASGIATDVTIDLPVVRRRDAFALRFAGTVQVPKDGAWTISIASDDGSRVYLDGRLLIDHDGLHGMDEKSAKATLKAGPHAIVVTYFDNGGGDGLALSWEGPGVKKQRVPRDAFLSDSPSGLLESAIAALSALPGHETEKVADLAELVASDRGRAAAVRALLGIDRKHWSAAQAGGVVESLTAWLATLPASERTQPAALDAFRLGQELSDPAARAKLQELAVRVVVVRPVPHQMVFDRKRFAVEAGKPAEIVFENFDLMPHNFVVTAKGAMEEVGKLAEAMGLEGQAKDFLPKTPKILFATKLVLPGESQRLQFTAPKETGRYPYVCTFPGHWMIMNGIMEVVEPGTPIADAEPAAAAAAPSRPFVRMWTVADLDGDLGGLAKGRNFARGKEMFATAGCAKCHVMAQAGGTVGPDLTKIAEKYKGRDLLLQLIDPSAKIEDPFRTHLVLTTEDDTVSGIIAKEDEKELHLRPAQADAGPIVVLPKSKIKARKPMELSAMPTGLLTTLQKDEILDLLAYLEAGGDSKAKSFK